MESALALPVLVLAGLGLLQLSLLQQGRLLAEYAAFCAARAGAVHGIDHRRMHDAALLALFPAFARADRWEVVGRSWPRVRERDLAMHRLLHGRGGSPSPPQLEAEGFDGLIRVDVLSPIDSPSIGDAWNVAGGRRWEELDLDAPGSYPQVPGLSERFRQFTEPGLDGSDQDSLREATVLRVRVRVWYPLVIPFAGPAIASAWMALHPNGVESAEGLETTRSELQAVRSHAHRAGRYFLPLTAEYRMRMQSNVVRRRLLHAEGGSP